MVIQVDGHFHSEIETRADLFHLNFSEFTDQPVLQVVYVGSGLINLITKPGTIVTLLRD